MTHTFTIVILVLLASTADAQPAPDWRWPTAASLAIAADFGTTIGGVKGGCLSGEKNRRYWGPGDDGWAQPDWTQMAVEAAIAAGATWVLEYATARAATERPGKLTTVLKWTGRTINGGVVVRRGYAAARNTVRCTVCTGCDR